MQPSILENLDTLSPQGRRELKAQIKRVQMEAKHLRAQMDELRRAQHVKKDERRYLLEAERAEKKERKHLREAAQTEKKGRKHMLEQMAATGQSWKQDALKRGEQLAATGQEWKQSALKRGEQLATTGQELKRGALKRGEQLATTGKKWKRGALKRGKQIKQLTAAQIALAKAGTQVGAGMERGRHLRDQFTGQVRHPSLMLYQQSQQVGQNIANWKDDLIYIMLKQGQHFLNLLIDRRDEATRQLRKQSKMLGRTIVDSTDEVAWQLHKQRNQLERNLMYQREEAARKLLKQGKKLNRHMSEHKTLWSAFGFVTGLLVAGGTAYWFMHRLFHHREEEGMESQHNPLEGVIRGMGEDMRHVGRGGTAVATRHSTRAEPTSMFVGVLNTKRYYPMERRPKVHEHELVFFRSEEDARAEGFTPAR